MLGKIVLIPTSVFILQIYSVNHKEALLIYCSDSDSMELSTYLVLLKNCDSHPEYYLTYQRHIFKTLTFYQFLLKDFS